MKKLKVDLHIHTAEDPKDIIFFDSYKIIDKAAQEGYDALSVTNHDTARYSKKLMRYAEKNDILLIPGMEATLSKKHVVVINPDFDTNPEGRSLKDLPKIKTDKNLIIAPHPFFPQKKSLKTDLFNYLPYFDAIEYSHFYSPHLNCNKKAVEVAKQHNKPLVGTSDCHFFWEFGTTYSLVEAEKNTKSIIEAIKEGKIEIHSTPLSVFSMGRVMIGFIVQKLARRLSP